MPRRRQRTDRSAWPRLVLPAALLIGFLLGSPRTAEATTLPAPVYRQTVFLSGAFDDESFFVGGSYRFAAHSQFDIGLRLLASVRIHNLHTVEKIRQHFYIQREESARRLFGFTVDKVHGLTDTVGLYLGVGGAYSKAEYVGTAAEPGSGWTTLVDAGLTFRYLPGRVRGTSRIGYQYADRFTSGKHMAYLALGIDF